MVGLGARGGKEKRTEAKKGWIDLGHTHTQLAKIHHLAKPPTIE